MKGEFIAIHLEFGNSVDDSEFIEIPISKPQSKIIKEKLTKWKPFMKKHGNTNTSSKRSSK